MKQEITIWCKMRLYGGGECGGIMYRGKLTDMAKIAKKAKCDRCGQTIGNTATRIEFRSLDKPPHITSVSYS